MQQADSRWGQSTLHVRPPVAQLKYCKALQCRTTQFLSKDMSFIFISPSSLISTYFSFPCGFTQSVFMIHIFHKVFLPPSLLFSKLYSSHGGNRLGGNGCLYRAVKNHSKGEDIKQADSQGHQVAIQHLFRTGARYQHPCHQKIVSNPACEQQARAALVPFPQELPLFICTFSQEGNIGYENKSQDCVYFPHWVTCSYLWKQLTSNSLIPTVYKMSTF